MAFERLTKPNFCANFFAHICMENMDENCFVERDDPVWFWQKLDTQNPTAKSTQKRDEKNEIKNKTKQTSPYIPKHILADYVSKIDTMCWGDTIREGKEEADDGEEWKKCNNFYMTNFWD
jgi:hypothetical protein